MKRFASIDFLRGIAIFMMLFLHQIGDFLDIDTLLVSIVDIPIINLVALVVLPFLGGLAGFFLLVSAIANSISMTNHLMKGNSVGSLALKQLLGGLVLYIFAMLSEGIIGYWGALGGLARQLNQPLSMNWELALTRWGNFETIHTIAWCLMVNGLLHALLSIKGRWQQPKRQMIIYAILTVIVVGVTPLVWQGVAIIIPGFPWKPLSNGYPPYMPHLLKSSFLEIIGGVFFGALAAPMEPIFPYLGVSFIGTMIGIGIAQPQKGLFKGFFKVWLLVGLGMFIVGAIGTTLMVIGLLNTDGFEFAVEIYRLISFHRHWAPDLYPQLTWSSYLWQFIVVNGFAIIATVTIIYLVEFRGRGKKFGENTKFIRRFGFVAFTNYNMQYIYPIVNFIIPQFMGLGPYGKTLWVDTFIQIAITILLYHMILSVWEKAYYRGSLEWFIALISSYIIPGKHKGTQSKRYWKERGDLDVEGTFYHPEWVNLVEETELYHIQKRDSLTALRFAIASLAIPLFVPFTCYTLAMSIKARKMEGRCRENKIALLLSLIGVFITILFTLMVFLFTLSDFGITSL